MSVVITVDQVTPLLAAVKSAAESRDLILEGARAVAAAVREHLYGLDAQRSRSGLHFYRQAAERTTAEITSGGAIVTIAYLGFRQRLLGGPISPRHARFLTIPAIPAALGTRARQWSGLRVGRAYDLKNGAIRLALIRPSGQPVFWLVRSVRQAADPSVLPPSDLLNTRAQTAIRARLQSL